MNKGLMLIDESNWGFAAASTKRLSVGEQDTHAVFGFIRRLRQIIAQFPILEPICLADGISWRYSAFADYKAGRDKPPETKQEILLAEVRKSFKSQKLLLIEALKLLGVRRMHALNMEADDLAAILVARYADSKRILMLTGDKDWLQLIRPSASWMDVIHERRIGFKTFAERTPSTEGVGLGFDRKGEWIGISRPDQWADVKCLMGDVSDEVPGVGGIGEKGAIELVRQYGSVYNFFNAVMDKSIDPKDLPKKFRDLALSEEKHDIFRRNEMLMNLETTRRPQPNGLTLSSPKLDKEGFRQFCTDWMFQSILTDFDNWVAPFERKLS